MRRLLLVTALGLGLIWGGIVSAAEPSSAQSTDTHYNVDFDTTTLTVCSYVGFAPLPGSSWAYRCPPAATLVVAVEDQAGKPVAGVPVTFTVAPDSMIQGMVSISPQQTTTGADGIAHARLRPTREATKGVGEILARVGNTTQEVGLTVRPSPRASVPTN